MPDHKIISQTCYHCHGSTVEPDYPDTGDQPPSGTMPCHVCNGEGIVHVYSLNDDLIDLLSDISNKVNDIKEKIDEM